MGGSDVTMEEIASLKRQLAIMEAGGKRKSATGRFSVKKKLRVAPITKRMRSTGVTPRTPKRPDTRTSRSRQIEARNLSSRFDSVRNSRSTSRPAVTKEVTKDIFIANRMSGGDDRRTAEIGWNIRKNHGVFGIYSNKKKTRKVRHKNARTVLNKMPAGGKPYARKGRKSMKKPKGAYRGAVMPRWAKGETKHVLIQDGHISGGSGQVNTAMTGTIVGSVPSPLTSQYKMNIGDIQTWSLNPIAQGHKRTDRNGASVDGTYLRIQGHIHNVSVETANGNLGVATAGKQRCYARMLVLAVKGSSTGLTGSDDRSSSAFSSDNLFKKIDGSIAKFSTDSGDASDRVRTLQLGVNKQSYTLLADRKFELSGAQEGFGASDRLFDMKIPIKQKTSYRTGDAGDFEKNQLVFVVMTVDPNMNTTAIDVSASGDARHEAIQLEFESKYSYKDF